jgi:hypothetical protein
MKVISDGVANFNSQIGADRQLNQSELLKVNQEIEKLKDRVFARQTCGNTAVSQNHGDIARLNNASQGMTEATTNTSHSASEQGIVHLRKVCNN